MTYLSEVKRPAVAELPVRIELTLFLFTRQAQSHSGQGSIYKEPPLRIELRLPPYQGGTLPLCYGGTKGEVRAAQLQPFSNPLVNLRVCGFKKPLF